MKGKEEMGKEEKGRWRRERLGRHLPINNMTVTPCSGTVYPPKTKGPLLHLIEYTQRPPTKINAIKNKGEVNLKSEINFCS